MRADDTEEAPHRVLEECKACSLIDVDAKPVKIEGAHEYDCHLRSKHVVVATSFGVFSVERPF